MQRRNTNCTGKRIRTAWGFVLCLLMVNTSCGDDGDTKDDDTKDTGPGENDTDSGTDAVGCPFDSELAEADADDLFDWPNVPTFDIYLPAARWEALQKNARDEEYVEAAACFEGRGIGTVGLRFKGNVGSLYSCFNEKDENICRKLGMKLKFSEYDKENRFFGLKRLNFQGNRYDNTYIRETLSYDLYRAMDIVAPRASWAEVRVNDELIGLFGMVEQIDGRFTDNRWPENGDGNLYKEVWPINTDEDFIVSRLKTNEDEPDVEALIDFSEAMNAADEADLGDTLDTYMDLDYLARYMVVDDAIANFDGITAYYTAEDKSWTGNHNFYIYEEGPEAFTMIPWDLESTFNTSSFGYVPHWTQTPDDCDETYSAWGQADLHVIAPGCDVVFKAMAQDLESYQTAGEAFLADTFKEKTLHNMIDDDVDFIKDAVENDPNGPGLDAFDQNVGILKQNIAILRTRLEHLLTGEPVVPLEIDFDGVTDFESQTDVGLIIGTGIYINPTSTAQLSINQEDPMEGERSLHIGFEYANGEDPWDQWLQYHVRISGEARDLSKKKGIRLLLRADQPRTLRIELESRFASADDGWLRPGWDIEIDEEAKAYEVSIDDTDFPGWIDDVGVAPVSEVADVLTAVSSIIFSPQVAGVDDSGYLPDDTTDKGFVEVDHIEFF